VIISTSAWGGTVALASLLYGMYSLQGTFTGIGGAGGGFQLSEQGTSVALAMQGSAGLAVSGAAVAQGIAGTVAIGSALEALGNQSYWMVSDDLALRASAGHPVTNSQGESYPKVADPRTGEPIKFPEGQIKEFPVEDRIDWIAETSRLVRRDFIRQWIRAGFPVPPGGWGDYALHHIRPIQFGGTSDFWNLVPLDPETHQLYTNWWRYFVP